MQLNTKRTVISPIAEKDIPAIMVMYREPDTFKYVKPQENKSNKFYHDFLRNKIKLNTEEIGFWCVYSCDNNEFVGTVNLNQFADTEMIQIGCHLKRQFWNKGYATELLDRLFDYAINERGLTEVYGVFVDHNKISQRLLEKLGFTFFEERIMPDEVLKIYRFS